MTKVITATAEGVRRGNLEMTKIALRHLKNPESLITYPVDRQGQDSRYSLNSKKAAATVLKLKIAFEDVMRDTIDWFARNDE